MEDERTHILQMVSEGKVSAEEASKLMEALHNSSSPSPTSPKAANWFHVRVSDLATGKNKVNVNLPFSLVRAGIKVGARFAPELHDVDWEEMVSAIQEGVPGRIVEVEDEDAGEKVEIYVE
jgi:SHOCT-like domain